MARSTGTAAAGGGRPSTGSEVRRWLLTGVSYMIPFVAAGGLLIALGFLLAGYPVALTDPDSGNSWAKDWVLNNSLFNLPTSTVADLNGGLAGYLGAMLFFIGSLAFSLFIPAHGRLHRVRHRRPARASLRASSPAWSPSRSTPASSAPWSAASSPASRRCG